MTKVCFRFFAVLLVTLFSLTCTMHYGQVAYADDHSGNSASALSLGSNFRDLRTATIVGLEDCEYDGNEQWPEFSVFIAGEEVPNSEYGVEYCNNIGPGRASVTITGYSSADSDYGYYGAKTFYFNIWGALSKNTARCYNKVIKKDIYDDEWGDYLYTDYSYSISPQVYTGKPILPKLTVDFILADDDEYYDEGEYAYASEETLRLRQGVDYTLSYTNNKKVGTATVTVVGTGFYKGSFKTTFKIAQSISKAKVTGLKTKVYNGKKQTQAPVIKLGKAKLKKGRDYTVTYKNNIKAGKATVVITGKGNYTGVVKKSFVIKKASLKKVTVAKITQKYFTGSAAKPKPIVKINGTKLKEGTDYTLSYKNNKKTGRATVVIKGRGSITDKKSVSFTIAKLNAGQAATSGGGNTVYITKTGAKYHRDGCRHLSKSKIPISRSDAIARGYEPCKVCSPG